ncbi:unnamed protein product [Mytilus edulis]|uniref:Uncharacterized protein n=1 Tax=Mytilus edulis TaxID=6550 RepID=A0A8S3TWQ9_MYTED|nr:unnamed protein product [Mytilus edulis]
MRTHRSSDNYIDPVNRNVHQNVFASLPCGHPCRNLWGKHTEYCAVKVVKNMELWAFEKKVVTRNVQQSALKKCGQELECGHICKGTCGECFKEGFICLVDKTICHAEEVTEVFLGNEDEPDARYVQLEDCEHVFEFTRLRLMDGHDKVKETMTQP